MASLHLRNVRKSYGSTEVIHGVDLEVDDGELIVIVGPSGCGKSTLLRMVAGLEYITEGEIHIGERKVNDVEPKDRDIAMVFQTYALYPHMSVYRNMAYGLRIAGKSKAEIDERVNRAAKMLELGELLNRKPRQLSGGQRQRVAMGRAIVREPSAFLFDEPLSNLDAKLRVQMRLEIKSLQRALGTTSLYVTHDQVEAMTLADRLVVMNGGIAEQIDTPMNVYRTPNTQFVAGFIGSPPMNFIDAKVTDDKRGLRLADGTELTLASGLAGAQVAQDIAIGVRPEDLTPTSTEDADFFLTTRFTETLGAETLVHGSVAPEHTSAAPVTARLAASSTPQPGDKLGFRIGDNALHLFDPKTGRRVQ